MKKRSQTQAQKQHAARKAQSQSKRLSAPPPPPPKAPAQKSSLWRRFWTKVTDLPWWADVVGIVAFVLLMYEAAYATIPEISAEGDDPSSPFLLPFKIKNPSHFFSMEDTQMFCVIWKVTFTNPRSIGTLAGFTITDDDRFEIFPTEDANHHCLVGTVGNPDGSIRDYLSSGPVSSAHISIHVKYRTLWFSRQSRDVDFTWFPNATSPRWIEGKIQN